MNNGYSSVDNSDEDYTIYTLPQTENGTLDFTCSGAYNGNVTFLYKKGTILDDSQNVHFNVDAHHSWIASILGNSNARLSDDGLTLYVKRGSTTNIELKDIIRIDCEVAKEKKETEKYQCQFSQYGYITLGKNGSPCNISCTNEDDSNGIYQYSITVDDELHRDVERYMDDNPSFKPEIGTIAIKHYNTEYMKNYAGQGQPSDADLYTWVTLSICVED